MKPPKTAIFTAATLAVAASCTFACLIGPPKHRIDPSRVGVDVAPPSKPHVVLTSVVRGRGPVSLGNGKYRSSSLDDLGIVSLSISGMADGDTPPEAMGLRIVSTDTLSALGRDIAPVGDVQPRYSVESGSRQLGMCWVDGATDIQEAISLRLLFYAIDSAGNVSTEADTFDLVDPGRQ